MIENQAEESNEPTPAGWYWRNRTRILARLNAQRRALGKLIGRGGPGRGTGRKQKQPGERGTFTCANANCGIERARTRNSLMARFCSQACASAAKRVPRGGIGNSVRECLNCHQSFHPKLAKQRNCGSACARSWVNAKRWNPLKSTAERARRRRACVARRARGATGRSVVGRWRRICHRDGWICWICRGPIDPTLHVPDRRAGTADHYVPLSKGGKDHDDNLRAAHLSCNSRRCAGRIRPHDGEAA